MLTVNVCCDRLATPMTDGPVSKSVANPPIDSAIVVCAGQNRSGTHCATASSSRWKLPVIGGTVLRSSARSAARRSTTAVLNGTTTGWATPTTSPRVGSTDTMASCGDRLDAAVPTAGGPAAMPAARTIATRTHLPTWRIASVSQ